MSLSMVISCVLLYGGIPVSLYVLLVSMLPMVINFTFPLVFIQIYLTVVYWTMEMSKRYILPQRVDSLLRAVLITGCGKGFGYELAKKLDSEGYTVFASCRTLDCDGARNLKDTCSDRLHVLKLDVTGDESIQDAYAYIKDNLGKTELWAVVNNAGIFEGIDVQLTDMGTYIKVLHVNTLGVVRVTKQFLPLLIKSKGRVIAITSPAGRVPLGYMSANCMSKFATFSFCGVLRQEMQPWGVRVITVEPEMYKTPLVSKEAFEYAVDNPWKELPEDIKAMYGSDFADQMKSFFKRFKIFKCEKVYQVIDCLFDAVSLEMPSNIYKPRNNIITRAAFVCLEIAPQPLADLMLRIFNSWILRYPVPKQLSNRNIDNLQ